MRGRFWILAGLVVAGLGASGGAGRAGTGVTRIQDVVYGRKHGVALTLDVFRPEKPSGIGVLYMVSGGWRSSHDAVSPPLLKRFTDRGQTVFAVVHGSQPKYTIPEILRDVERATRFVRYRAGAYGVDSGRLGMAGASAGGHLSLMQGTRGGEGDPLAKDPVEQASSRVQAVGCFFPPTDFLNYGREGQEALTYALLRPFYPAFGVDVEDERARRARQREVSPVTWVSPRTPPTLILHGDADALVPVQQAERFVQALEKAGVPHRLVVRPGAGHGWPNLADDVSVIAAWFEEHLRRK